VKSSVEKICAGLLAWFLKINKKSMVSGEKLHDLLIPNGKA
jgi:hypothetical protein